MARVSREARELSRLAQGRDMGAIEGHVPDRFDQLFGFVMPFRPPVHSTPHARVVDDTTTVVGEVDMFLTQGASWEGVTEKRCQEQ